MSLSTTEIQSALGLDVSMASVTLFDTLTGCTLTIDNDDKALETALAPLRDRDLAVCEATGGHEDKLLHVLHRLGITAHRADAAKVKAYIRSFGKRAKTDAIDARWLSRYAVDRGTSLVRWQPTEPAQASIEILVARRQDLVAIKSQEQNRLKAPRGHLIEDDIRAHIAELEARIGTIETRIDDLIAQNEDLKRRAEALRSIPGVGPVLAPMLVATMPELGTLNRRQAASLAGCAPHPRDSGKLNGHRHSSGGRRQIRPGLFIAALAATRGKNPLANFYKALVSAGKPKRLALAAVMRKIITIANARIRDATNLQPN